MVKKILGISCAILLTLFWVNEASADKSYNSSKMESWIDTKKEAEICASTDQCDVVFSELTEQPSLWIGKTYFDPKPPINIAYNGNYSPNGMVGYIGTNWYSFSFPGLDEHPSTPYKSDSGIKLRYSDMAWTDDYDRIIRDSNGDDGGAIPKNGKIYDTGELAIYRHTIKIAHALQYGLSGNEQALVELKNILVEGAKGDYLTVMKPSNYFYKHRDGLDYPGFAGTLKKFYKTLVPLVESHIVLQRNGIYSEAEFELVHSWIEKRVWGVEQGVMDGTITKRWRWKPHQEAIDHEMIEKRLLYLLWGVADQNDEYFTAGVNGFKDAYTTIRRDGSLKTEHRNGNGNNFGLFTGNYTIQTITNMAIVLHNHGWDIQEDFPKIEKMMAFTSKIVDDPTKSKYFKRKTTKQNEFNHSINFMNSEARVWNTIAYVMLWDKTFNTEYSKDFPMMDEPTSLATMGIVDAREIVVGDNHLHSINYKYEDSYPWMPASSDLPHWSWFLGEKNQ